MVQHRSLILNNILLRIARSVKFGAVNHGEKI